MKDYAILSEDGRFRSSKMEYLAQILEDFDPTLELRWIPPEQRKSDRTPPYCIVHNPPLKKPYVIGFFYETDDPRDVLARLWAGNTLKNNVLGNLEAQEAAREAFELKERMELGEQMADEVAFFFSGKNYLRYTDRRGDPVVLDENRNKRYARKTIS